MWFLVWELRCSTEGQKLGPASKINLGVSARCLLSVSARLDHVLGGEHPAEEGLSCGSPSSRLKSLGYCIEIVFTFFIVGFPTRKRLLLRFKRVGLCSCKSSYQFTR